MSAYRMCACACAAVIASAAFASDWISFTNETSTRLIAAPHLGAADVTEKDFAWGDLDQDGDIDLVCVRKQIGSTAGRFPNVLFMNEGSVEGHEIDGVLVDRTGEFAAASLTSGMGFLDETNDRDVAIVDVNGDGWLDVVTATTYGQGLPTEISHPRVYINLGAAGGQWQGLRHEAARMPLFTPAPSFCSVGVGDLDGSGLPDLYFTDYTNTLEDRLLMNNGSGTFIDQTALRTFPGMITSVFATHGEIADINGDGRMDIVKSSSLEPYRATVAYNNGSMEGFFTPPHFQVVLTGLPYFISVADLNNDGMLDLIETDDEGDRYLLNQGNGPSNQATWLTLVFPNSVGLGSHSIAADLDNDGFKDVLIADVDVDVPSCTARRLKIFRNHANPPDVTFAEDTGDIPHSLLNGTFHTAVFDLNGDGWLDVVIGRCSGTQVWINYTGGPPDPPPPPECPADLSGDGVVNAADLAALLGAWFAPQHDLNDDGTTNAADLAILLGAWGPCG